MRLDKFLKISRIIKRRTMANEICSARRVQVNQRIAKAGSEIKLGDIIEIKFGNVTTRIRVLQIKENVKKETAAELYEIIEN